MTDNDDGGVNFPMAELPGHAETREMLADHIAASPHPKLAAASVLTAAVSIALIWNGPKWLEGALRGILEGLPDIAADPDEDLRGKH